MIPGDYKETNISEHMNQNRLRIVSVRILAGLLLVMMFFAFPPVTAASWYQGDDLGYLDYVKVNGNLFEDLNNRQIIFYSEDLTDGKVEITGILESEKKDLKPEDLRVQISLDGGDSWQDAAGEDRWSFVFAPELETYYDLSIRVVKRESGKQRLYRLGDFLLSSGASLAKDRLSGEAGLALGWLAGFVPEEFKKPGTDELLLSVKNLEVSGDIITGGEVRFDRDFDLNIGKSNLHISSISFTPDGANISGRFTSDQDLSALIPVREFTELPLTPAGISHDLNLVSSGEAPLKVEIISGRFGVGLSLTTLSLRIDTSLNIPVSLSGLDGRVLMGPGYGSVEIPGLNLLKDQVLAFGVSAAHDAGETMASIALPGTGFSLSGIGGTMDLRRKSVILSGAVKFPESLGGASITLPEETPLVLSSRGISSRGEIRFSPGSLINSLDLGGFPTRLTELALEIRDNVPSGTLEGELRLSSFGDLPLQVKADISKNGLGDLDLAMPLDSPRSFSLAGFACLTLSRIGLNYADGALSVDLDGSISPAHEMVSSLEGIGDALVFEGLEISRDAIRLAGGLAGWHKISGAGAQFQGTSVSLTQYGVGVENNLFWVGLKGELDAPGASASATARIFHDGTAALEGLSLSGLTLALGEFTLKVDSGAVDPDGIIQEARGAVSGLPSALVQGLPKGILSPAGELDVTLQGLEIDLAARRVNLGTVSYTPHEPLNLKLGPASLSLEGLDFSPSHAALKGRVSLSALNLPLKDLPFDQLCMGRDGIRGTLDLTGLAGRRRFTVLEGDFGFGLNLSRLVVGVDSGRSMPLRLEEFEGGLFFGPGFGGLEIPDLKKSAAGALVWGKQAAGSAGASLARLSLPGDLFSLGNLGGALDLGKKELTVSGTLFLPPALGSGSITLPDDRPLVLSAARGLSTGGMLEFDPGDLPTLEISNMATRIRELALGIDHGEIAGRLAGTMDLAHFAGFKLPVSVDFDKTGIKALGVDDVNLNKQVDLAGFAALSLNNVSLGYEDDNFFVELDGAIAPTHPLLADFTQVRKSVDFSGLRILKSGIRLVDSLGGWTPMDNAQISVNSATLSLAEYGLGVKNGKLWFGVKGEAAFQDNTFDLTAKIFQDGTTEISDFNFDGLTLALGEFVLKTCARVENGILSGEGLVDMGILAQSIPDALKDPVTGAVKVSFKDLVADLSSKTIISGQVTLPFATPLDLNMSVFSGRLRSVTFGTSGASVDGDFTISSLAGVELPQAPDNFSFRDISLSPDGFAGTIAWENPESPLLLPVLTGDYGVTLRLSRLGLRMDTRAPGLADKVRPTDLDGDIILGPGYNMAGPLKSLRLMADQAVSWGTEQAGNAVSQAQGVADDLQEQAEGAQDLFAQGFSFTIPGTRFLVNRLSGRLYLGRREMEVWGELKLPPDLGGSAVGITRENALVLSAEGVSTRGPVSFNPGSIASGFSLAGYRADLASLSLGISQNTIEGSVLADIRLDKFDGLPIAVAAAFNGDGIDTLSVASDRLERDFTIADFARIKLSGVSAGYENSDLFVKLDGSLTLDTTAVGDPGRSFDFKDLKIYKDALAIADASLGMHDIPGASISMGDDLTLSLNQYGVGVEDDRFWIALAGGLSLQGQEVTATARLYHDGEFVLDQMGADDLVLAIGDFSLRTSFAFARGAIEEAEAGLNLGAFMSSIPDRYKNSFGELPVTVKDLDIDLSDPSSPRLVSGTVVFAPVQPVEIINDLFTARFERIEVGATAPYGKVVGGTISLSQGPVPGLENITVTELGLTGSGLTGTLTWEDSQGRTLAVVEHENYGIDAVLKRLSLAFNSSGETIEEIIQLRDLGGHLSFGPGYATALTPALSLVDGAYAFAAGEAATLTLPGTSIGIKGFSGALDMAEGAVTLGGRIELPYEGTKLAFDVDGLVLSSSGIDGAVSLESPLDLSGELGFSAILTRADIAFEGFSISSGGLGLNLTLEKFFGLQLAADLALDSEGISDWSIGGETDAEFTADAGFATMKVSDVGAGYSSEQGLFVSLDTDVEVKADSVISGLPDDLNLAGIKVYNTDIDIDGAEMAKSFSGKTATLAGLDLTLTKLGVGYSEKFYLLAGGKLNIADLCEAGAELKLYSDLSYDIDEIEIDVKKPAFAFAGYLAMTDDEHGWGFSAEVDAVVAGTLPVAGALELGSVYGSEDSPGFSYWRVAIKTGTMIPLAPVPLNVYGIGGGIAYHMSLSVDEGSKDPHFTPDSGNALALTALLDLGSTDNGAAWFGKFALTMEPENFRVVLEGDSWIMEGRSATGQGQLSALIELGGSPAVFHVAAGLHLVKEVGGLDVVDVDGEVDLLFAENDWHIYFGSKDKPISATVLHFLGGDGYLQIDSQGLAMGVSKKFDLYGSAWIFYGRLYGGAEVDLEAGVYPFYVDVRGRVWIGLEAGVTVAGSDYEIISAYAELGARFKAPPIYIGFHGKLHYSFLFGTIEGNWDMTFTYPKNPPEGAADSGIEDMPLVSYALPENQSADVGRLDPIIIKTTMPIQEVFEYDGKNYILYLTNQQNKDELVDFKAPGYDASQVALLRQQSLGLDYPFTGGLTGGHRSSSEIRLQPVAALDPGETHFLVADFQLREWNSETGTPGRLVSEDGIRHAFRTAEGPLSFRERVREVYPGRNTTPVYRDTDIYLTTKAVMDGHEWTWAMKNENLTFKLLNGVGDEIPGRIEGSLLTTDIVQASRQYMVKFIPESPLEPVRMVEDPVTGIKRKAVMGSDGKWANPFLPVQEAPSNSNFTAPVQQSNKEGVKRMASKPSMKAAPALYGMRVTSVPRGKMAPRGPKTTKVKNYKWYWDGRYRIEISDAEGSRKFTSGFNLALPPEGTDTLPYGSTSEVIAQTVSNPHFKILRNVDQDALEADVSHAMVSFVYEPAIALFHEQYMDRAGQGSGCAPPASPRDVNLQEAGMSSLTSEAWVPLRWQNVSGLSPSRQYKLFSLAMAGCREWEEAEAQWENALAGYREEMFEQHSVKDFKSIEFRFTTAAPINWSEVQLGISVNPRFAGDLPSNGSPFDAYVQQCVAEAWFYVNRSWGPDSYMVRSRPDALHHVVELPAKKEYFNGNILIDILNLYQSRGVALQSLGGAVIYEREIRTTQQEGWDESSRGRGEEIYSTGPVNRVVFQGDQNVILSESPATYTE